MPGINAFDAKMRNVHASKAFSERQPAIAQARASSDVGCFLARERVRKCKVLGRCSQMTRAEAECVLSAILREVNSGTTNAARPVYTFEQYVNEVYLPFARRSWKESTAATSEQIVKSHLLPELGRTLLHAFRREDLQDFLDLKALHLSESVVSHQRWFLSGIFKLAVSDGVVLANPAAELRIPRKCHCCPKQDRPVA